MTAIVRPMPSPALKREVPPDVIPFWPALVQQYDRVCNRRLLSLLYCNGPDATRPVEAQQARTVLPLLVQARREGKVDPVYLELAEVAAHLKLGNLEQARTQLRAYASSPLLATSLAAPARPSFALTIGAHPLWLVMHVAIEAGVGAELAADVLACGLNQRLTLEPELSAGLLLNALAYGDADTLRHLQAAQVVLTPRARALLHKDLETFAASLVGRAQRGVPLEAKEERYLTDRCRALVLLGEEAAAKRLQDTQSQKVGPHRQRLAHAWRRFLSLPSGQGPTITPPKKRA